MLRIWAEQGTTVSTALTPSSRNASCPAAAANFKGLPRRAQADAMAWVRAGTGADQRRDCSAAERASRSSRTRAATRASTPISLSRILQNHDDAEAPLIRASRAQPEHPYALCLYAYIRRTPAPGTGWPTCAHRTRARPGVDTRYQFSGSVASCRPHRSSNGSRAMDRVHVRAGDAVPRRRSRGNRRRLRIGFVTSVTARSARQPDDGPGRVSETVSGCSPMGCALAMDLSASASGASSALRGRRPNPQRILQRIRDDASPSCSTSTATPRMRAKRSSLRPTAGSTPWLSSAP